MGARASITAGLLGAAASGCFQITPELPRYDHPRATYAFPAVDLAAFRGEGAFQDSLRAALRAHGLTDRVSADAPMRIDGGITDVRAASSSDQIAWNVVNTVTLLFFLGGPYVGASEATVELRAYDGDSPVRTYRGEGRANWLISYQVAARIPAGRAQSRTRAIYLAIWDAVSRMARDPLLQGGDDEPTGAPSKNGEPRRSRPERPDRYRSILSL